MEYPLMQLHEDKEAFVDLVEATAEAMGLPQVYVEKDYWVTRALKFLAKSLYVENVIFKGGTSLFKAHRLIDRFSEDIDLAVFSTDKSDSEQKRLLKKIECIVTQGLTNLKNDERESKGSKFRKTVYQYPRCVVGNEFGQASSDLLIEVNAFTNPEPFESKLLQTLIAEVLFKQNEKKLVTQYGLEGFSVSVLSVNRTLVEKMLRVIKDSYHEDPVSILSGRIRHLYDICVILQHDEYRNFISSENFKRLCEICIQDEKTGGFDHSQFLSEPLIDAPLFSQFEKWHPSLNAVYTGVFSDLVYGKLPTMDQIKESLMFIRNNLD